MYYTPTLYKFSSTSPKFLVDIQDTDVRIIKQRVDRKVQLQMMKESSLNWFIVTEFSIRDQISCVF